MSALYTSYETSLRLKQAGTPQETGLGYWAICHECGPIHHVDEEGCCSTCGSDADGTFVRAWRSDEIIEALGVNLLAIYRSITGPFQVDTERVFIRGADYGSVAMPSVERDSLVEALAAAWVAVLDGAK